MGELKDIHDITVEYLARLGKFVARRLRKGKTRKQVSDEIRSLLSGAEVGRETYRVLSRAIADLGGDDGDVHTLHVVASKSKGADRSESAFVELEGIFGSLRRNPIAKRPRRGGTKKASVKKLSRKGPAKKTARKAFKRVGRK